MERLFSEAFKQITKYDRWLLFSFHRWATGGYVVKTNRYRDGKKKKQTEYSRKLEEEVEEEG